MASYLIGIDIGTQGTKTILFDTDMRIAASAFEASNLISPKPGVVWQEADDIYGSCVRTIRQVVEEKGIAPADVLAIGIDSQMAGIMGVDENCEAVTYYDSWLDTRCEPYMEVMRQRAGKRVTQITGGPVTYTHGPKILWWKGEHPEQYEKTARFVLPHGYVVGRMCGLRGDEICFDYTCIQYSGFGDNEHKRWSDELLGLFSVEKSKMARIVSPFEVVGKTTAAFAAASGLAQGIPMVAGGGDTACSIFGSGLFDTGLLYDCAGTASVMCSVTDRFVPDDEYETLTMMRSPADGFWFPLAYINGGGMCLKWFRDNMTGTPAASYAQLEEECKDIAPGSEGVLFVPHFAGRVLPNNPYVKGSFAGLDWKHTRGHLFRAVMEGVAYEYHYYLSVLKKLYPQGRFSEMVAVGGGAKSALFNAIKADVLGVPVRPFEMGEAALVGSAVIAGVGAGVFSDYHTPIRNVMRAGAEIRPNAENHARYGPYATAYLQAIDALTPVYKNKIYK